MDVNNVPGVVSSWSGAFSHGAVWGYQDCWDRYGPAVKSRPGLVEEVEQLRSAVKRLQTRVSTCVAERDDAISVRAIAELSRDSLRRKHQELLDDQLRLAEEVHNTRAQNEELKAENERLVKANLAIAEVVKYNEKELAHGEQIRRTLREEIHRLRALAEAVYNTQYDAWFERGRKEQERQSARSWAEKLANREQDLRDAEYRGWDRACVAKGTEADDAFLRGRAEGVAQCAAKMKEHGEECSRLCVAYSEIFSERATYVIGELVAIVRGLSKAGQAFAYRAPRYEQYIWLERQIKINTRIDALTNWLRNDTDDVKDKVAKRVARAKAAAQARDEV